ncbi:MAG: hypothetical protein AAGK21_02640 [Bacteroidota bacterium]
MHRLLLIALLPLAACAGTDEPEEPADVPVDSVTVISNEGTDVIDPDLAADAPADTTGPVQAEVAGETVPMRAVVTGMESGDLSCYLSLRTDGGAEETVFADYSVCDSDAIVGRRVQIEYQPGEVMAASCEGDPDCLDTDRVALAISAEPID